MRCDDFASWVDCFVGAKKLTCPAFDLALTIVKSNEVEVPLVGDDVEIGLVLVGRNHLDYLLAFIL